MAGAHLVSATAEDSVSTSHITSLFFSSRRRHTRFDCDWSSDVCSSDLHAPGLAGRVAVGAEQGLGQVGRVLERSEEHTSELQSQSNLVCRLLLEKKKKKTKRKDMDRKESISRVT